MSAGARAVRRERRRFKRLDHRTRVRFSAGGVAGSGFATNLSPRGLFIQCDFIPIDGVLIELIIRDPAHGEIPCRGRVILVKRAHRSDPAVDAAGGFGVELVRATQGYHTLIQALNHARAKARVRPRD